MNTAVWTRQFWKTTKEISVTAIIEEAERSIEIVICGELEFRESIENALGTPIAIEGVTRNISPNNATRIIAVVNTPSDTPPNAAFVYSVDQIGSLQRTLDRILEDNPEYMLALGRKYPGLRPKIVNEIIANCAVTNAEFAMLNALPGVAPGLSILLPAGAISDMIMLTKNQAMMLYRLAAVHGKPLDIGSRSRDIAPLLGNAFGWRAIARELVGVVPGGIGLAARGAIAYAGTVALGRALTKYYVVGRPASAREIRQYYKDAISTGKSIVLDVAKNITGRKKRIVKS